MVASIESTGDLSDWRRERLHTLGVLLRSPGDWKAPEVQEAYGEYLQSTLAQACAVLGWVEANIKGPSAQAAHFASDEGNRIAIFRAIREAIELPLKGRYCDDNPLSRESWKDGTQGVAQAEWVDHYNDFCDYARAVVERCSDERVRELAVKYDLEKKEWESPPTRITDD